MLHTTPRDGRRSRTGIRDKHGARKSCDRSRGVAKAVTADQEVFMAVHSRYAATIRCTEFQFASIDGSNIACARWDSQSPVHDVIQIAHDMNISRESCALRRPFHFGPPRANAIFVSEGAEQISATLDAQATAQLRCEEILPGPTTPQLSLRSRSSRST